MNYPGETVKMQAFNAVGLEWDPRDAGAADPHSLTQVMKRVHQHLLKVVSLLFLLSPHSSLLFL